jgi:hypothetical protein
MNRKAAAPVILTVSLVVLMSGGPGAAAHGGQVQDDLRPAANAAILGLARGHVIVRDDLSPTRELDPLTAESIVEAVQSDATRAWSAEARREFHAQPKPVERAFSPAAIRELKGSAPVDVRDDLSPLRDGTSTQAPQPGEVDDDQSPLRGDR